MFLYYTTSYWSNAVGSIEARWDDEGTSPSRPIYAFIPSPGPAQRAKRCLANNQEVEQLFKGKANLTVDSVDFQELIICRDSFERLLGVRWKVHANVG